MSSAAAQRRVDAAGWLWISPWVIGFLAFMLLPMGLSLYYSLTDYPLLEKPLWVGLDNYRELLRDEKFLAASRRTLVYAAISIPASTALALVIAGLLSAKVRAAGLFQAAVFLPTLVPLAASAMVWLWLFNGEYGLINRVLRALGLAGPGWLTDADWAMAAVVIIGLWGVGQAVITYVAAMRDVPESLYEAAELDGMGPVRRFVSVTLPMISPVILFNVVTLTIGAVQVFGAPFIIRSASVGGDTSHMTFYSLYLYDNAFTFGRMGYASAMAWLQMLAVLVITAATFVLSRRLVHYRA